MKKAGFIILTILFLLPILALAQEDVVDPDFPFELNDSIVVAIQTIFGIGLMALTQLAKEGLKKVFKDWDQMTALARHAIMYAVTAIIAAAATYFTLNQMGMMTEARMILYSIYTWGYINQSWKALKEIVKRHS